MLSKFDVKLVLRNTVSGYFNYGSVIVKYVHVSLLSLIHTIGHLPSVVLIIHVIN